MDNKKIDAFWRRWNKLSREEKAALLALGAISKWQSGMIPAAEASEEARRLLGSK